VNVVFWITGEIVIDDVPRPTTSVATR
jgi:hypothetical protein